MVNRNQYALTTLPYNNGKILNWNTIGCRMTAGLMLMLSCVGQCRTICLCLFSERMQELMPHAQVGGRHNFQNTSDGTLGGAVHLMTRTGDQFAK